MLKRIKWLAPWKKVRNPLAFWITTTKYYYYYPVGSCPWLARVCLLVAVCSLVRHFELRMMSASFRCHAFKSSLMVAVQVFQGLPLTPVPSISRRCALLMHGLLHLTWPNQRRHFSRRATSRELFILIVYYLFIIY